MRRTAVLLASALLLLPTPAVHAQTGVDKAAKAVSADVIRAHIDFLASDALEGRGSGTRGGDLAARYIAAQYIRLGLEPAGDDSTYFFKVPLISFTPNPTLSLGGDGGGVPEGLRAEPDALGLAGDGGRAAGVRRLRHRGPRVRVERLRRARREGEGRGGHGQRPRTPRLHRPSRGRCSPTTPAGPTSSRRRRARARRACCSSTRRRAPPIPGGRSREARPAGRSGWRARRRRSR